MDIKKLVKVADSTKAKRIADSSERYDYEQAVRDDVEEALCDYDLSQFSDSEAAYEALYDDFWTNDSVTGNGSGSYWFNAWKAEEALCHNWDILETSLNEMGMDDPFRQGAEVCDVTIRCYLLGAVLQKVLDELFEGRESEEDIDNEEVTEE